jgi:hypothetical protein
MIIEDKNTELFCMADDFCKFYDTSTLGNLLPFRFSHISA